jgi:hypothetical protein
VAAFSPPKPRLTLRVGIAGHRPDKLDDKAVARVKRWLPEVFVAIDAAAKQILSDNADCYAEEPPALRLVSGFAQGTDQIPVRLCPAAWRIEAILPFAKDTFLDSFTDSEAAEVRNAFAEILKAAHTVTEVVPPATGEKHPHLPGRETRGYGYADGASYFLRQIDLLIVAWDGHAPRTAGTGAMARLALEGGLPVVWIATNNNHVPRLIEKFDDRGHPTAPMVDCTKGPLATVLQSILGGPSAAAADGRISAQEGLRAFYGEAWRERCKLPFFDMLKRGANRQRLRYTIALPSFASRRGEWAKYLADAPDTPELRNRIDEVLLPRYLWADALAVYFSHHYRSAYVLAYALSALAVFIALGGQFAHTTTVKAAIVLAELVVIAVIIGMIGYGRRWRWHERWLDYRKLAENLRHSRFLAFVSEFGDARSGTNEATNPEPPWTLWYLRATMREVGLPTARLDGTYQWRLLNATRAHEIDGQVEYHESNSKSAHAIEHLLYGLAEACFWITAAALALFLIVYLVSLPMHLGEPAQEELLTWSKRMIFLSAGLPALGAAVAGIRIHGDFEGSRLSSIATVAELKSLQGEYRSAMDREIDLDDTGDMLIRTARVMSEDLDAWQDLYGRKRLVLPA